MIYNIKTCIIKLKIKEEPKTQINSPEQAYKIANEIYKTLDADQEHMLLFALDSKNNIKAYKVISSGGQCNTDPDFKIIFRNALLLGAVNIIMVHNHPSGDPTPSNEDKIFTDKLKEAGNLISIPILDHIIIGENKYFSFMKG